MTDQPRRPAGPPRPAPRKPVPAQKKHLRPHDTLPDELKKRALEPLKLARHQMHPVHHKGHTKP